MQDVIDNEIETLAKQIASDVGFDFDTLYETKRDWSADRGRRHPDVNTPHKADFRRAAGKCHEGLMVVRVDLRALSQENELLWGEVEMLRKLADSVRLYHDELPHTLEAMHTPGLMNVWRALSDYYATYMTRRERVQG